MKHKILTFLFLLLAGASLAQPVTRVRLITLQDPPDTTAQYYIQGGGGKDTIKWVPIDTISAGAGADGDGIKDATTGLPGGDVTIAAAGNGLVIDNMDTLALEATAGMSLKSNDIWLTQSSPNTTNIHTSPFTNFEGTGYVNFNVGYFAAALEDSVRIITDGFNDVTSINSSFVVDKYAAPKFPHFPSSFSEYTGTADEGRIVYNSTDNVPMYWDGTQWVNLTIGSDIPAGPAESYAISETNTADLQNVGTTWEALEAQTSAGAATGWSFSTGTDLWTYSGTDGVKHLVNFSVCFTMSSAALLDVTFTVQENGSDTNAKAHLTTSGADADITYCASGLDIVTANSSDTFGLGFLISSGTHNVTIESSQLTLTKLVGQ